MMIQKFVDTFMNAEQDVRAELVQAPPGGYLDLVSRLVTLVHDDNEYSSPDPARIHVIDDGDYQGTLLFIISGSGYQPSRFWSIKVSYGSCSGCDTFESIREYGSGPLSEQQVQDYWTLMLHMVQRMAEVE
jgi:hypothetical protein